MGLFMASSTFVCQAEERGEFWKVWQEPGEAGPVGSLLPWMEGGLSPGRCLVGTVLILLNSEARHRQAWAQGSRGPGPLLHTAWGSQLSPRHLCSGMNFSSFGNDSKKLSACV